MTVYPNADPENTGPDGTLVLYDLRTQENADELERTFDAHEASGGRLDYYDLGPDHAIVFVPAGVTI